LEQKAIVGEKYNEIVEKFGIRFVFFPFEYKKRRRFFQKKQFFLNFFYFF
jgi:hypothetical protein